MLYTCECKWCTNQFLFIDRKMKYIDLFKPQTLYMLPIKNEISRHDVHTYRNKLHKLLLSNHS